MSQVKQIVARFGRKRQPAQYESAEAVLEFTLQAAEDGSLTDISIDHVGIGERLLGVAKNLVLRELGVIAPGADASAATVTTGETKPKKATKGKDAGAAAAASATANQPAEQRQISSGSPDRVDPAQATAVVEVGSTATPQQTATSNVDIPGTPAPTQAVTLPAGAPTGPTAEELTKWVGELVKGGKLDSPTVKAISRKFGAEKIAFIPADKLTAYKAEIDEAVKRFGAAADL